MMSERHAANHTSTSPKPSSSSIAFSGQVFVQAGESSISDLAARHKQGFDRLRRSMATSAVDRGLRARQVLRFLRSSDDSLETHRFEANAELERIDPGLKAITHLASTTDEKEDEEVWMTSWVKNKGALAGYIKNHMSKWLVLAPVRGIEAGDVQDRDTGEDIRHVPGTFPALPPNTPPTSSSPPAGEDKTPTETATARPVNTGTSPTEDEAETEVARRLFSQFQLSNGPAQRPSWGTRTDLDPAAFGSYVSFVEATAREKGNIPEMMAARASQPPDGTVDAGWYAWYRESKGHGKQRRS
nr:uncharacterized protein CTRU02_14912 [Colletotrichum truncatum]KAF6781614.1 hypothetical protein CTRU02_14912 [Colletotrichum truncatum]